MNISQQKFTIYRLAADLGLFDILNPYIPFHTSATCLPQLAFQISGGPFRWLIFSESIGKKMPRDLLVG